MNVDSDIPGKALEENTKDGLIISCVHCTTRRVRIPVNGAEMTDLMYTTCVLDCRCQLNL